jgi:SAM-dependent methyltransferase
MTLLDGTRPAEKETSTAPYDDMAPDYEAFVGDEDEKRYPAWLAGLIALAAEHGVTSGRALDVGCGTGRSLMALRRAGFTAAGIDPSRGMMEIARGRLGDGADLVVGGLPDLPPGPAVDLVTAFNDIINCVAPPDLDAAIASLAARVAPGGVLLFDANTPLTFTRFFGRTFCRTAPDGRFLVWESLEPGEDGGARAHLHVFVPDPDVPGRWTRRGSDHVQHHHPHDRVVAALEAAGLQLLDVQGQRDEGPRDSFCDESIHTKRIYVARRP